MIWKDMGNYSHMDVMENCGAINMNVKQLINK